MSIKVLHETTPGQEQEPAGTSETDILQAILADINSAQVAVGVSGMDEESQRLTRAGASITDLLKGRVDCSNIKKQRVAGHRRSSLFALGHLGTALKKTGLKDITEDDRLHKLSLLASIFVQRAETYFSKKAEAGRLIEDESR